MNNRTRNVQAAIFGVTASGKTALTLALKKAAEHSVEPAFSKLHVQTIGIDFRVFATDADTRLMIWDLSGSERFKTISLNYNTAKIIYLVIDPIIAFHPEMPIDFAAQKKQINEFMESVKNKRQLKEFADEPLQINLLVSKNDLLPTKLTEDDKASLTNDLNQFSQELSDQFKVPVPVIYTSAKDGTGLNDVLERSTNKVLRVSFQPELDGKQEAIQNVCDAYAKHVSKRVFLSTDPTRNSTVGELRKDLEGATDIDQLKQALIKAAKDIRTPVKSRYKYGVTFFFGFFHYGSYQNSQLYKLIKKELANLDKSMDLDALSKPEKPVAIKPTASISPSHSRV